MLSGQTSPLDQEHSRNDLPVAMLPRLLHPECHLQCAECQNARVAAGVATTQAMQAAYLRHRWSGWQVP